MNSTGKPIKLRKGAWHPEEDNLLRKYIEKYGEGKWHVVSQRSGLNRCRKSCRLRWLNYLRPTLKKGEFSEDEVDLMMRLHRLLGNRWTLIAGRLPGRTSNDVKNFWKTNFKRKLITGSTEKEVMVKGKVAVKSKEESNPITSSGTSEHVIIKTLPGSVSIGANLTCHNLTPQKHMSSPPPPEVITYDNKYNNISMLINKPPTSPLEDDGIQWWNTLLGEKETHGKEEEASLKEWLMVSGNGWSALESNGLLVDDNYLTNGWSYNDNWDFLNYDYN